MHIHFHELLFCSTPLHSATPPHSAPMAAAAWCLQFHHFPPQRICTCPIEPKWAGFGAQLGPLRLNVNRGWKRRDLGTQSVVRVGSVVGDGGGGEIEGDLKEVKVVDLGGNAGVEEAGVGFEAKKRVVRFREMVVVLPRLPFTVKRPPAANFFIAFCIAATCLIVAVRVYVLRKKKEDRPGTVADLVRRGQLRSDRRGISQPLIYDDPFNNPLVKTDNGNSTVEMCGKVYRLAPISLTDEQRAIHQKRRSRAYQWKRPTVFLKEGDPFPPDVDPDTVRWIPANHPFVTTSSDIDEGLAQTNVFQKHGVPFRIRAEHEALQKKLEALQKASPGDFWQLTKSVQVFSAYGTCIEQKLNVVIDPVSAKDLQASFKPHMKPDEEVDEASPNGQPSQSNLQKSDEAPDASDSKSASS
ncbi:MULTIPLE CHLOROPLAST DIVISION SITE 1-like protein [Drosera capensis]